MTKPKMFLSFVPDVLVLLLPISGAIISLLGSRSGRPLQELTLNCIALIVATGSACMWAAVRTGQRLDRCR